jgi:hypothetical protein
VVRASGSAREGRTCQQQLLQLRESANALRQAEQPVVPAAQNLESDEVAELGGQRLQVVAVERERREHAQPAERGGKLLQLVVGEVAYAPGDGDVQWRHSSRSKGGECSGATLPDQRVVSAVAPLHRHRGRAVAAVALARYASMMLASPLLRQLQLQVFDLEEFRRALRETLVTERKHAGLLGALDALRHGPAHLQ